MTESRVVISFPLGAELKVVSSRDGGRGGQDTMVDIQVGPIIIQDILIVDDRHITAVVFLPLSLIIDDEGLRSRIDTVALSYHYGIDD